METRVEAVGPPRRKSSVSSVRSFFSGLCSPKMDHHGPDTPNAHPRDTGSTALAGHQRHAPDMALSLPQKDSVFRYQMDFQSPKILGPYVFYVAGLVGNINNSPRIIATLKDFSILSHHVEDATVYTSRIDRQFTHQLPYLSLNSQRMLIALLFFWEEELARWTELEQELLNIESELRETEQQKLELENEPSPKEHHKEIRSTLLNRIEELTIQRTRMRTLYGMAPSMRGTKMLSTDLLSQTTSLSSRSTAARASAEGSWRRPSVTRAATLGDPGGWSGLVVRDTF